MELTCSTWGEKLKRKRKMWRQTGFVQILPLDRGWFLHHHLHSSSPRHLSLLTFLPSHYSLLSLWSPLFISSTIHLPPPRSCLLSITRLVSYSSISISLLHDFCKILKSLVTFGEHSQDNCLVKVCSVPPPTNCQHRDRNLSLKQNSIVWLLSLLLTHYCIAVIRNKVIWL